MAVNRDEIVKYASPGTEPSKRIFPEGLGRLIFWSLLSGSILTGYFVLRGQPQDPWQKIADIPVIGRVVEMKFSAKGEVLAVAADLNDGQSIMRRFSVWNSLERKFVGHFGPYLARNQFPEESWTISNSGKTLYTLSIEPGVGGVLISHRIDERRSTRFVLGEDMPADWKVNPLEVAGFAVWGSSDDFCEVACTREERFGLNHGMPPFTRLIDLVTGQIQPPRTDRMVLDATQDSRLRLEWVERNSQDNGWGVFDANSQRAIQWIPEATKPGERSARFSPAGDLIATGPNMHMENSDPAKMDLERPGTRLYDVVTGIQMHNWKSEGMPQFSMDGSLIVTVASERSNSFLAIVRDVVSGREICRIPIPKECFNMPPHLGSFTTTDVNRPFVLVRQARNADSAGSNDHQDHQRFSTVTDLITAKEIALVPRGAVLSRSLDFAAGWGGGEHLGIFLLQPSQLARRLSEIFRVAFWSYGLATLLTCGIWAARYSWSRLLRKIGPTHN